MSIHPEFNIHIETLETRCVPWLTAAPVGQLDERLAGAEASDASLIVIDPDRVSVIGSTGVHALLDAQARARGNGDRLRLTRGSRQAQRLFRVADVVDQLQFVPGGDPPPQRLPRRV